MFLTGFGNAFAIGVAIKYAQISFPNARGTASSIPMATFGLSAFIFSSIAAILFPGDTPSFLFLLATVPPILSLISGFFIREINSSYEIPSQLETESQNSLDENSVLTNKNFRPRLYSNSEIIQSTFDNTNDYNESTDLRANNKNKSLSISNPISPSNKNNFKNHAQAHGLATSYYPEHMKTHMRSLTPSRSEFHHDHDSSAIEDNDEAKKPTENFVNAKRNANHNNKGLRAGRVIPMCNKEDLLQKNFSFPQEHIGDSKNNFSHGSKLFKYENADSPSVDDKNNSAILYGGKDDTDSRELELEEVRGRSMINNDVEIHGLKLLKNHLFWRHFVTIAIFIGSGQMFILSCGYCIRALILKKNPNAHSVDMQALQSLQVGLISITSSLGRLISGVLTDVIEKRHGLQRTWIVLASGTSLALSQIAGAYISNASSLWIVAVFTGLGYGMCFGSYPSITGRAFGMSFFSQNWGLLTTAPVFGSYFFNTLFGSIYDSHSIQKDDGSRLCLQGRLCYASAFKLASFVSIVGILLITHVIYSEYHNSRRRG